MTNDVDQLTKAVEQTCNCKAVHTRSERVTEKFQGELVWDGIVEVFTVFGAPEGVYRAYAWCYPAEETRYIAVLGKPPVTDARAAVQAAIVSGKME